MARPEVLRGKKGFFGPAKVYAESNIGRIYGIPEWIRKYPPPPIASLETGSYIAFEDLNTGEPAFYFLDNQTNHAVFVVGTARMSGKTTFMEIMLREEMRRGAFVIIFDIKGEYPNLDYGVPVKKLQLGSMDDPLAIKPSHLTPENWGTLSEIFAFGKDGSTAVAGIARSAEFLVERGLTPSVKNIRKYISTGNIPFIRPGTLPEIKTRWFLRFVEEKLAFLNEDTGVDLEQIIRDGYGCLIVQYRDYPHRDVVSMIVDDILNQLYRLKAQGDPKRSKSSDYRDMWDKKVIVVIDEGGDSELGLANKEKPMKCFRAVEQAFTQYPYAKVCKMISTQIPQNISTKVVGNCPHVFVGRMTEENAIEKLSNMGKLTKSELLEILPRLKKGEFVWMHGDEVNLVRVRLPNDFRVVT